MSNQFYSYLSNKIITFFRDNPLIPGLKFNIQFEKEEQVKSLYKELQENTIARKFEYKDSSGTIKYTSYELVFNDVSLIISCTDKEVHPDFLTRLRNIVGAEEGYEKKSILFIHNTSLDSIIGGTESFSKEGMPLHIDSIQKDIKIKMVSENFSEADKLIIKIELDKKRKSLNINTNSVFEYEEILSILENNKIEKEQYKEFGLFYDDKLNQYQGKELKNRINNNASLFNKVYEIHNYGNPDIQLDKYFEEKGASILSKKDWMDTEYKIVKKSADDNGVTTLEYIKCNHEWDKEEGTTKSKLRTRNVIVFNEKKEESVEVEFTFDDFLKKDSISKKEGELEVVTSGKKLKVTLKDIEGKSKFYKVVYNVDKIKFEFKMLMLNCNPKYIETIKSQYSLVLNKKKDSYISINTNDPSVVFNEYETLNQTYELDTNKDTIDLNKDSNNYEDDWNL